MLTSPVHLSRPHHYLNQQQQHQQPQPQHQQQQPHQQNQTFYQHTPASAAAFQHHLQQLKDFDTLSQQFQSTSQSQHNFSSTPLTPAPSQSHSINLPYSSTPPSAGASPTYSCPAFSTHNSPDFASSSLFQGSSDSFMTDHSFSDSGALPHTPPPPPIKVFRSTPPETAEETFDQEDLQRASMLLQSGFPYDSEINSLLSPSKFDQNSSRAQLQRNNNNKTHSRTHSSSSNVSLPSSTAVPSLSPSSINTNNGNSNYQGYSNNNGIYERSQNTSKLLPTPEHTPVQGSFLAHPFQSYDPSSRHVTEAEIGMAMRRAVLGQGQGNAEDEMTFPYSLAPSVSTLSQNSPATPHTSYADELDDGSKTISHGETNFSDIDLWMDNYLRFDLPTDLGTAQMNPPKTNRAVPNVYQDDLYNPSSAQSRRPLPQQQQQQQQQQSSGQFYQSDAVMGDRLRAPKQGHIGHSPSSISRQASPLRQSPYVQPTAYHSAHLQQPSHANSGLREMELLGQEPMSQEEPKTISPKDAVLDYRESPGENNAPLFQPDVSDYDIAATTMGTSDFTPGNNFPAFHHPTASQIPQAFYLQQNQGASLDQRHMIQNLQDQAHPDSKLLNRTPDFPAQIPSMESTNNSDQNSSHGVTSPAGMFRKEQASSPQGMMRRPEDTSADSGTYSCTYHGCTQRFESPAKLQKHKREAHRQTTPGSHGLARDGSAGRGLSARNSQAGPHKCERINPATGKPCNSIFSRPYDLTRHEDTIHNARKQKVRCHLCTEEKTFSRNDALTRHMRVVHPGVEWPGKQRRRGRE